MIDYINSYEIELLKKQLGTTNGEVATLTDKVTNKILTYVVNTWADLDTLDILADKDTIQTLGRDSIYDGMSTRWIYLLDAPLAVIDGAKFKKLVTGPNTAGVFLNLDYRA